MSVDNMFLKTEFYRIYILNAKNAQLLRQQLPVFIGSQIWYNLKNK